MFRERDQDGGLPRVGVRAGRTQASGVEIVPETGKATPQTSKAAPETSENGPSPEPQARSGQGGQLVARPAGQIIEIDAEAGGMNERATRKPNRRRLAIVGVLLLAAIGAAGTFGYRWWTVGRFTVSTDDAYVRAHNTTLAAKIPGLCRQRPGRGQRLCSRRRRDRDHRRW